MKINYTYTRYGVTYHWEYKLNMEEIKREIESKEMTQVKLINT